MSKTPSEAREEDASPKGDTREYHVSEVQALPWVSEAGPHACRARREPGSRRGDRSPGSGLVGSEVRLTLEIEADIPDGAPEHVKRIVIENSRNLNFDDSSFENE